MLSTNPVATLFSVVSRASASMACMSALPFCSRSLTV
ncbi:Uncharacterised protein [Mycobacteroides abscessus subsp. abscessus]|nr:Uncharacterised protein [Mycobacteroides abscessus subsp. abscessus]